MFGQKRNGMLMGRMLTVALEEESLGRPMNLSILKNLRVMMVDYHLMMKTSDKIYGDKQGVLRYWKGLEESG